MPEPGSTIWVEFEEGDIDRPIWTGATWGTETPGPLTLEVDGELTLRATTLKVDAAMANARAALALDEPLSDLIWRFAPADRPAPMTTADVPAETLESRALTKELKANGFVFVGPTTAYALMQAAGLVNDHLAGCAFR